MSKEGDLEVWMRPLSRNAYAIGLFNRGESSARTEVNWSALKLSGPFRVRDLWAHRDLGAAQSYAAEATSHGVVMIRVSN